MDRHSLVANRPHIGWLMNRNNVWASNSRLLSTRKPVAGVWRWLVPRGWGQARRGFATITGSWCLTCCYGLIGIGWSARPDCRDRAAFWKDHCPELDRIGAISTQSVSCCALRLAVTIAAQPSDVLLRRGTVPVTTGEDAKTALRSRIYDWDLLASGHNRHAAKSRLVFASLCRPNISP